MALIDHFDSTAGTDTGQNGFVKWSGHLLPAGLILLADGHINKQQLMDHSDFQMTQNPAADADEIQLDQIIAKYNAEATDVDKLRYLFKIEKTLIAYNNEAISQALAKTALGLT